MLKTTRPGYYIYKVKFNDGDGPEFNIYTRAEKFINKWIDRLSDSAKPISKELITGCNKRQVAEEEFNAERCIFG